MVNCQDQKDNVGQNQTIDPDTLNLIMINLKHITPDEHRQVRKFIENHLDVFAANTSTGPAKLVQHRTNTGSNSTGPKMTFCQEERYFRNDRQHAKIRRHQKDFYVDYRRLIEVIGKDSYPLPRIDISN